MSTTVNQIPATILSQLGGARRLQAMVGAKHFLADGNALIFAFKGCGKANKVRIELNAMDTYDVTFYKINMRNLEKSMKPVDETSGIYADQLVELFERFTGMYLSI